MEKRASERIPVNIEVKFKCRNMSTCGTITDISENGMFIDTEDFFLPSEWQFELFIYDEEEKLCVDVDIKRVLMNPTLNSGIGVELISPSAEYVAFVKNLMTVYKS